AFYNREPRGGDTRAYRRLPKSAILAAPLGARTRFARQRGVFSKAKPPKKRILFKIADFYNWQGI
ncbi:MAG TPA: hypothetical protein H9665_05575, partial [Firmicutes bacterium]|nr:hypothetical protein [Bacillota bacterium]